MSRHASVAYGSIAYGVFLGAFLYAVGFVGGFLVPKTVDSGPLTSWPMALIVNTLLLGLFAVQHSVMARPAFKRLWTKIVPEPVERSTYVLFSSVALMLVFWQWQPIGGVVWDVGDGIARAVVWWLYAKGLAIVLLSTFLINHFDLFGLRQVWLYLTGRRYTHLQFRVPFLYKLVRHPLYVGWVITFWAAPVMTAAHLFFAILTTAYMLVAIRFEESDLVDLHGENYERYRREVPMMIPSVGKRAPQEAEAARSQGYAKVS
jgi:protein-S-isoprenylcysteine O-methyltransferase Ste14